MIEISALGTSSYKVTLILIVIAILALSAFALLIMSVIAQRRYNSEELPDILSDDEKALAALPDLEEAEAEDDQTTVFAFDSDNEDVFVGDDESEDLLRSTRAAQREKLKEEEAAANAKPKKKLFGKK